MCINTPNIFMFEKGEGQVDKAVEMVKLLTVTGLMQGRMWAQHWSTA